MHFLNQLLPEQERVHLAQDEAHSLREIDGTLGRLCVDMGESAVVDQKRIAFLLRLLRIHRAMKYILPVCCQMPVYDTPNAISYNSHIVTLPFIVIIT